MILELRNQELLQVTGGYFSNETETSRSSTNHSNEITVIKVVGISVAVGAVGIVVIAGVAFVAARIGCRDHEGLARYNMAIFRFLSGSNSL